MYYNKYGSRSKEEMYKTRQEPNHKARNLLMVLPLEHHPHHDIWSQPFAIFGVCCPHIHWKLPNRHKGSMRNLKFWRCDHHV